MIAGLDHVGVSSRSIDRDIEELTTAGYQWRFRERNLANPPEKQPVLVHYQPSHELTLLTHPMGVAIELLDHGGDARGQSPMSLVLTGPGRLAFDPAEPVVVCGRRFNTAVIRALSCHALMIDGDTGFACTGVCVRVNDLASSLAFWTLCGCEPIESDDRSAHLSFRDVLTNRRWSVYLVLVSGKVPTQHMDCAGVNSVAFVSTSISKAEAEFVDRGFATTRIYNVRINGRLLSVMFVRGPSGENVEIISPAAKQSGIRSVN